MYPKYGIYIFLSVERNDSGTSLFPVVLCSDSISQSDIDIEKPVLVNTESHSIRLQSVSPKLSSKGQRHFSTSASTTIQTL